MFIKRGYIMFIFGLTITLLIYPFSKILSLLSFILSIFSLWFHREPEFTVENHSIVSPSDGRIREIDEKEEYTRVSIYLGLTDVHTIHSPIDGKIENISRYRGSNYPAFLKKSQKNNCLTYDIDNLRVHTMTGFIARRLVPLVNESQNISKGSKLGYISFGSKVIVDIPNKYINKNLNIESGDKIVRGEKLLD